MYRRVVATGYSKDTEHVATPPVNHVPQSFNTAYLLFYGSIVNCTFCKFSISFLPSAVQTRAPVQTP